MPTHSGLGKPASSALLLAYRVRDAFYLGDYIAYWNGVVQAERVSRTSTFYKDPGFFAPVVKLGLSQATPLRAIPRLPH